MLLQGTGGNDLEDGAFIPLLKHKVIMIQAVEQVGCRSKIFHIKQKIMGDIFRLDQ